MKWRVEFHPEAVEDLERLDPSMRKRVLHTIKQKLETSPKDYGDHLGSKAGNNLTKLYSLRAAGRRIRIIYFVRDLLVQVLVVAIGRREGFEAHDNAGNRIRHWLESADEEFKKIERMTGGGAG